MQNQCSPSNPLQESEQAFCVNVVASQLDAKSSLSRPKQEASPPSVKQGIEANRVGALEFGRTTGSKQASVANRAELVEKFWSKY